MTAFIDENVNVGIIKLDKNRGEGSPSGLQI